MGLGQHEVDKDYFFFRGDFNESFCFSWNQLTKEMVMEKPSAQLVGREFVRQYYTLLNQAPDYLHRSEFAAYIQISFVRCKWGLQKVRSEIPCLKGSYDAF